MKKALRKASITSEDDSILPRYHEDDTDTDHHDSLPHDEEIPRKVLKKQTNTARRNRKPSIMDIVQIAKKQKINEAHPKGKFKINRNITEKDDIDPEVNSRIVTERRRSLLKRQSKVSEPSDSQPEEDDQEINYEVINEKNKQMEKKSKRDPEIFTFDEKPLNHNHSNRHHEKNHYQQQRQHQHIDISSGTKTVPVKKKKSTSDIFFKRSQHHESSPNDETSSPPSPANEVMATLNKGRRKIGSFLALVKEAVNTKKNDESSHHIDKTDGFNTLPSNLPSPTASAFEIESPNIDEMSTEPEDADSRKGSMKTKKSSSNRKDSQASIWSDKLPTIKISKTEGEECISESSEKDNSKDDNKSENGNGKEEKTKKNNDNS